MHVLKALALILLTFQLASTAPLLGPPPPPPPSGNTGGNDTDDQKAFVGFSIGESNKDKLLPVEQRAKLGSKVRPCRH
ncbi:hypothetical protein VTN96DRAFT_5792 [Rasamsonia emersonii]